MDDEEDQRSNDEVAVESEEGASQENIDDESKQNYELENIKIKASKDRLDNRARNSKFLFNLIIVSEI